MRDASHLVTELGITVGGEANYYRAGIAGHAKNLANRVKGNIENSLIGLKVEVIPGRGVFTSKPHEVRDEFTGKVYKAKGIILAQGQYGLFLLGLQWMKRLCLLVMEL
jgi:dihydrolipoamide dehydrogenase